MDIDPEDVRHLVLVTDEGNTILKKKSSILSFCQNYLEAFGPKKVVKKAPKATKKKAPPKPILKKPAKKKKARKTTSTEDSEESSSEAEEVESSEESDKTSNSSEDEEKSDHQAPAGYANVGIKYKKTKEGEDIMEKAKEMARGAKKTYRATEKKFKKERGDLEED